MASEAIKQEAEYIRSLGDAERQRKQDAMTNYQNELAAQVKAKNSQWTQSMLVDEHGEGRHTGLGIGNYKEPSKDELMATLKMQVENKNNRLENYAKIETNNASGDWLGRKQQIDKWNYNYNHDHRRRNMEPKDNARLLELKEMAIRENHRKRRDAQMEKQSDVEKVNDLVHNERNQNYQAHVRSQQKAAMLQSALETQLQEKAAMNRIQAQQNRKEATGTSFVTGSVNKFGNSNFDQRPDMQLHREIKVNNFVNNNCQDQELIHNLDK